MAKIQVNHRSSQSKISLHSGKISLVAVILFSASTLALQGQSRNDPQNPLVLPDPTGQISSYSTTGSIDTTNAFFQNLGSNGRTCASCHVASQGWTVTPAFLQTRFDATAGLDPIFNSFDGTNCPTADVSTVQARRAASSLLLTKGLIRVAMPIPPAAEFTIEVQKDPTGCALVNNEVSVYRRPLPSTNVSFLSTVMWDGRENAAGRSIHDDLISQARDATLGHARAAKSPTDAQLEQIVAFQMQLFTAQSKDNSAGPLDAQEALGGAINLSKQNFFLGINDSLGLNPTGALFDPQAFSMFPAWLTIDSGPDKRLAYRQSIARGEALFNTKAIAITDTAGVNDVLHQTVVMGTCTTCHDSPNVGNHSLSAPLNIGITASQPSAPLDVQGLPVFIVRCTSTGQSVETTDPGRALVSGKCADIGRTKGPILRGLAARAPYFHNGSAATLIDLVNFYDNRFHIGLTQQEKADLVAVLSAF